MNQGLLVIVALLLIYLAISGRYSCITSAGRCVFFGEKMCACSGGATGQTSGKGGLPDLSPFKVGGDIVDKAKEMIDKIRSIGKPATTP
jgi:hypothetical protein